MAGDVPKNGDFVIPGTELGFSEEFIPGLGAYEEDGKIYASVTGILSIDMSERRIEVKPKINAPPVMKDGDVVIGSVADVKPQLVIVDIVKLKGVERGLPGSVSGSIHVSKTRGSYVADIGKEFKVGDIVYAKIINANRRPIQLSTADKDMGVIKAFCFRCSTPLVREGNKLKCKDCGRVEFRRMSPEYGKGAV